MGSYPLLRRCNLPIHGISFVGNIITKFGRNMSHASLYDVVLPGIVSERRHVPDHIMKPSYWLNGLPSPPPSHPEVKTKQQIESMKISCRLASRILHNLKDIVKVGITTDEIDRYVHDKIIDDGAYPSPLNYQNFPKSVCTSVNNVACHGIPDDRALLDGDIVNVDITVYKDGYHGDCSAMFLVGDNVDKEGIRLSQVTKECLDSAIAICHPGQRFSAIGKTIQAIAEREGFTVVPCFIGHGIGSYFHGPPDIYHSTDYKYSGKMKEGMTFTIEPVLSEGSKEICILEDGWTAVTEDNSRTAQWEHTVLITNDSAVPLTEYNKDLIG